MKMKALGVFEGGGVRGYAHAGALKACEERGIEFVGVAGTSIGAIVAALVAAGFSPDELYRITGETDEGLFAAPFENFVDRREFSRLTRFRNWLGKLPKDLESHQPLLRAASLAERLKGYIWSAHRKRVHNLGFVAASIPLYWLMSVIIGLSHWNILQSVWARSGVLRSDQLRTWLNDRLCERLSLPRGTGVTFQHLTMPLVLIAANMSSGGMTVFDKNSPDILVADAAIASASYPLVFHPLRIEDQIYVDGGLVSNFPAWALDDLRAEQDAVLPTFGFRVVDLPDAAASWPKYKHPAIFETLPRLLQAAAFGRSALESRRIDDLHLIEVSCRVKATDFDLTKDDKASLYRDGLQRVERYFAETLGPVAPERMEERLRHAIDLARDIGLGPIPIRAYLLQPVDARFVRVIYSALLEGDVDDVLLFRRDSKSQALCLARKEPILIKTSEISSADKMAFATKYVHGLRPRKVTHVYGVPLFKDGAEWEMSPDQRSDPIAALCFDFEGLDDRLLLEIDAEDQMAALGDAFVDCWMEQRESSLPASLGHFERASGDWEPVPTASGHYVSRRKLRKQPSPEVMDAIRRATL